MFWDWQRNPPDAELKSDPCGKLSASPAGRWCRVQDLVAPEGTKTQASGSCLDWGKQSCSPTAFPCFHIPTRGGRQTHNYIFFLVSEQSEHGLLASYALSLAAGSNEGGRYLQACGRTDGCCRCRSVWSSRIDRTGTSPETHILCGGSALLTCSPCGSTGSLSTT